jgi:hypothetical protein
MKSRWDRHDEGIHARVGDRVAVTRVAALTGEVATELLGLLTIAARVAAGDFGPEPAKMTTVHPGYETAA